MTLVVGVVNKCAKTILETLTWSSRVAKLPNSILQRRLTMWRQPRALQKRENATRQANLPHSLALGWMKRAQRPRVECSSARPKSASRRPRSRTSWSRSSHAWSSANQKSKCSCALNPKTCITRTSLISIVSTRCAMIKTKRLKRNARGWRWSNIWGWRVSSRS